MEGIFIALGMLFYAPKETSTIATVSDPNLHHNQEIYIGSEMRRFKRINYKTQIEIMIPGGRTQRAETIDISLGGVCFSTPIPFKTDKKVKLTLDLLRKKKSISATGRIAWIKRESASPRGMQQYKVGVEFVKMTNDEQQLLSEELKLYYE